MLAEKGGTPSLDRVGDAYDSALAGRYVRGPVLPASTSSTPFRPPRRRPEHSTNPAPSKPGAIQRPTSSRRSLESWMRSADHRWATRLGLDAMVDSATASPRIGSHVAVVQGMCLALSPPQRSTAARRYTRLQPWRDGLTGMTQRGRVPGVDAFDGRSAPGHWRSGSLTSYGHCVLSRR